MTMDDIKALIEAMGASDLAEMELARDGWTLKLVRHAPAAGGLAAGAPVPAPDAAGPRRSAPRTSPAALPAAAAAEAHAPLSGIAHLGPAPEAPPFIAVGQAVEPGTLLCTIEAMKTFHEVRAERGGVVAAVQVASGDEVEAGQPLVRFG